MADWIVDIGFNTTEMVKAMSGAKIGETSRNSSNKNSNRRTGMSKAVKEGMKATGILKVINSLKSILEIISFGIVIISSFLGFMIQKTLEFIIPFFKDPFRALLPLIIFAVNGILTGIEFLINTIAPFLTLGKKGFGTGNPIELPRFQKDIILQAYDDMTKMQEALSQGKPVAEQLKKAQKDFSSSIINSFLTDKEYSKVKKIAEDSNLSYADTFTKIKDDVTVLNDQISVDTETTKVSITSGFSAISGLFSFMETKANELRNSFGDNNTPSPRAYGPIRSSSQGITPPTPQSLIRSPAELLKYGYQIMTGRKY